MLLLVVGLASLGYAFYLTRQQAGPSSWANPWEALRSDRILPGIAVGALASKEPSRIYQEAMAVGSVETATAEALTASNLSETQRLGWLIVLARRYAEDGERARATHLFQLAVDLALLAPNLGDHQRADSLLGAANGWLFVKEEEKARNLLVQVRLIATRSPYLEPPVRRELLDEVARLYQTMGDIDSARAARAQPAIAPAQAFAPSPDPLLQVQSLGAPVYPKELLDAEARRRAAAQAFVDLWVERRGQVAQGSLTTLGETLLDEDLLRSAYYNRILQDVSVSPLERARVQWDQSRWLAMKHRTAAGLYGDVMVAPNWKVELPAIRQSAHDAFGRTSDLMLQHIKTLPPEQQAPATYNLYRDALAWGLSGLNPDADVVFLANAMNDALLQWQGAADLVTVAVIGKGGSVSFKLIDASQSQ